MPGRALEADRPRCERFHNVVQANRGQTAYRHNENDLPNRNFVPVSHSPPLYRPGAGKSIGYI
jgi:hypothetical protein